MKKREKSILQYLTERGQLQLVIENNDPSFIYLRKLVLQSEEIMESASNTWDYKSLSVLAEEAMSSATPHFDSTKPSHIPSIFAQHYGSFLHGYFTNIDDGLPVYSKDSNGKFTEAQHDNPYYSFVLGLIKYGGWADTLNYFPPDWASNLYLKLTDIKAYSIIFYPYYDLNLQTEVEENRHFKSAILRMVINGKLKQTGELLDFTPPSRAEPEASPKSRNAYLRTIDVLACALVGGDLNQPKIAETILAAISRAGLKEPVDAKTLSNYLKEAKLLR